MSNFGLSCDVCNRENVGITWVNGMKFCAKCYQETFGKGTSQYVDMLHKEMYELKIANLEKQVTDLQQQLAEKYKEIEQVTSKLPASYEKEQNQKAIEQLEKVKGLIANHTQELWTCENDDIDLVLYEEIDNQIKELKGEE